MIVAVRHTISRLHAVDMILLCKVISLGGVDVWLSYPVVVVFFAIDEHIEQKLCQVLASSKVDVGVVEVGLLVVLLRGKRTGKERRFRL